MDGCVCVFVCVWAYCTVQYVACSRGYKKDITPGMFYCKQQLLSQANHRHFIDKRSSESIESIESSHQQFRGQLLRHVPYSSRYLEIGTRAGIAYSRAVLYVIYMYIYYMYRYLLGWTSVHGRITSVILSIINFKGVVNHCFLCQFLLLAHNHPTTRKHMQVQ